MSDSVSQIVRGVPADLKSAIRREVEGSDTNMNDLVVGILARKFEVSFSPSGRRSAHVGDSPDLLLRMPEALRRRIKVRAANSGSNQRDVIVAVLSEHFGTRFASAPRRPRSSRAAA